MGYRNYIYSMPKKEYNKIKSLTKEELIKYFGKSEEDEPYVAIYKIGTELYEFGKYVDFQFPKKSYLPFFKKKELKEEYEHYDPIVVKPELLESIIDNYRKKIVDNYNDMLAPFLGLSPESSGRGTPSEFLNSVKTEYDYPNNKLSFDFSKITQEEQNKLFDAIQHIRSFRTEWVQLKPYDLSEGDSITTSWKYEYGIFELVRIYKSFDWKKNVMFYCGW